MLEFGNRWCHEARLRPPLIPRPTLLRNVVNRVLYEYDEPPDNTAVDADDEMLSTLYPLAGLLSVLALVVLALSATVHREHVRGMQAQHDACSLTYVEILSGSSVLQARDCRIPQK